MIVTLPDDTDRFARFKLIGWWDQTRLATARVLVIGAGALGNEIVKNLALLGIGNVLIADKDTIENSNLSRSVLYREQDVGQPKAIVAALAAKEIYPGMRATHFHGDVIHDLGAGVYRWADVIIGGLDNREARLHINRTAWRVNRAWVDGAIEQIQGVARVFQPDAEQKNPCYECTMSDRDWQLLQVRRSCNLLTRAEMQGGKTPTTPTISSIIAGVQVQEALKLIHGMESLAGRGFVFQGMTADSYTTEYQRKETCYSHDTLDEVLELTRSSDEMTVGELLAIARKHAGREEVEVELGRDILAKLVCPSCKQEAAMFVSLGKVKADAAKCPACGAARDVVTFDKLRGNEGLNDRTLASIGVPKWDIVTVRRPDGRSIGLEFAADRAGVLGELADEALELI